MKIVLLLMFMLFFHIVDDYYLQGVLAPMKQKSWWKKHAPEPLYKNDYLMALAEHAFSWTVMIHIPIIVFAVLTHTSYGVLSPILCFLSMWILHAWIDHHQANLKRISLIKDQLMHVLQIIVLWLCYVV